jgi:two-component sensor histidine kinase
MSPAERFAGLPTAAKLFLILTAAILPIGIALMWIGEQGIRQANNALEDLAADQARATTRVIESLIARNALALRIAAKCAIASRGGTPCDRSRRSLSIAPAVTQAFELARSDGSPICAVGEVGDSDHLPAVAPGAIDLRIASGSNALIVRVGVVNGMATALIPGAELRSAAAGSGDSVQALVMLDGERELRILGPPPGPNIDMAMSEWPIGNGEMRVRVGAPVPRITVADRLLLLLPVLMWIAAAVITWLLVGRLLIRPLKRLQRAVLNYQPGEPAIDLPNKLGPSREIQELRDAFARAISRVDESERELTGAFEGQRRLVREVHHRVKNNLQVVASLLNIHGRSAGTPDAQAAYAGISRRVGALSVVHRNHFAEMEENRGIALRPLLTELAAELRASAPETARGLSVDLDLESIYTTQDVAVAVAFLVTEIVEFAMLNCPKEPIDISLRRTSEITGRLTLSNHVLNPDDADQPDKVQFERIVAGLAKQLRSSLERKLGRYSVDLPVFPPA